MMIGELSRRSGLSAHTIRYYELIALLPYAERDRSGRRNYDASILTWIEFLDRLKTTGMPIREMLRYAALREQGAETETERCNLLATHRERVRAQIAALNASLLTLDTKIDTYAITAKRTKSHDASLTQRQRKPAGTRQARAR